jgi:hypothetical protein
MIKIFYSFLISCFIFVIISCGNSTEENVSSAVSKTNDAVNDTAGTVNDGVFGGTDGSGAQCKSGVTFQKKYFVRQVKQTNDCGYIAVSYAGYLTKLNQLGEKVWEKNFTLKKKKHSNLGKSSVLQTSDGGYLFSGTYGIAKFSSKGDISWKNQQYGNFEDAIEHSNGFFYAVSDELTAHNSMAKVYKFNRGGKKIWRRPFGGGCSREKLRSILETPDGELVIVGGKSHGNNQYKCTFEFYDDAWIIKVDADNGKQIWEKTYGGRNYEHFEDIVKNPNGGYYAIGTACNKKNPPWGGDYCAQNMSALWMKFDESGNSLKTKYITNGPNQTGFSIANTSSGGTAWVGERSKLVGSKWQYKAIFYKLQGTMIAYQKSSPYDFSAARSIELTKDGGFIIAAGSNVIKTGSDMKIPTLEK